MLLRREHVTSTNIFAAYQTTRTDVALPLKSTERERETDTERERRNRRRGENCNKGMTLITVKYVSQ